MWFLDPVFSFVWDAAQYFFDLAYEVEDFPVVGPAMAGIFQAIGSLFWSLITPISHLNDWLHDASERLAEILSESQIFQIFRTWIEYAEAAWNWIRDSVLNVVSIVESWWTGIMETVQAWINQAFQWALSLLDQLDISLGDLRSSWNDFWTTTWPGWINNLVDLRGAWDSFLSSVLPGLATWTGSESLIESALKTWFPFYDELVVFVEELREFFEDPGDYIISKIEDALERLW